MLQTSYSKTLKYSGSFDQAVEDITRSLQDEGFGILTQINVNETFKKKLKVDFPRYQILGACNPSFAHQALQAEKEIGLLLPCNVIIYDDGGEIYISIIKPTSALTFFDNPKISKIAIEVEKKLNRALQNSVKSERSSL